MEAKMYLYGADPLAEAKAEIALERITLDLLEIQEFFNENHGPDGRFVESGGEGGSSSSSPPTSGRAVDVSKPGSWEPINDSAPRGVTASANATLNEVHSHLTSALNIVGAHTQEGSLISRVMNGIREVQKGSAARKEAAKETKKEELEAILKLPRWRDTNPSKGVIGRVGEFLNKAASTIQEKWKREPDFRKDVYKEAAMAISGLALHVIGPVPEGVGLGHAAIEGVVKSIDALKKFE